MFKMIFNGNQSSPTAPAVIDFFTHFFDNLRHFVNPVS